RADPRINLTHPRQPLGFTPPAPPWAELFRGAGNCPKFAKKIGLKYIKENTKHSIFKKNST
ncbi:MAG TPA: hypothetical protein VJK08_03715, partial [Patescibacteria group bacterium]|nr:hypothetical protein [Patescibacteria group bacterium]